MSSHSCSVVLPQGASSPLQRPPRLHLRAAAAALVAAGLLAAEHGAHAAATTDGSVGAVQTLSGAMLVPQALGTVRGANLFHSFARFGIAAGESATFTTTDAGLRHVITRVTGGEASLLQGPLALVAAGGARPDFWLVNPAGVLVGAGASFDVPAGLHLSTAPQLRFADGSTWATGSAAASTLSVAAPESFGFLTAPAAALRWVDSDAVLAPGSRLSLSAGEIVVDRALLQAPGGEVALRAQRGVTLGAQSLVVANITQASDAGRISVDAGSMRLESDAGLGAFMLVQTGSAGAAGGITIKLSGALELGPGAEISSVSVGQGGGIAVTAARLRGEDSNIGSRNLGNRAGPTVTLALGGALELLAGARVDSSTQGSAGGTAGDVLVNAGSMRIEGTGLNGASGLNSLGRPGALTLATSGPLELRQGASVSSVNTDTGLPGAVLVQAARLLVDGAGVPTTLASLSRGSGPSAAVRVEVSGETRITDGGQVFALALGSGDSGSVRLQSDTVWLQGGAVVTGISTLATAAGRGGAVDVQARTLDVRGSANISSRAGSTASGAAGNVTVLADRITLDGQGLTASIDASAFGLLGSAAQVRVVARDELVVRDGGSISAIALGSGDAGSVDVTAGTLLLDGRGAPNTSTAIGGVSLQGGAAAPVVVQAGRIEIREGGLISSSTSTAQAGGAVTVRADTLLIDGGGNGLAATGIRADSSGVGDAGAITIAAREITLVGAGTVSASTVAAGRGGNIGITAERLRLERAGGVLSVTGNAAGDAGRITLDIADTLTLAQGGFVVANTGGAGAAGRIDIRAGSLLASGSDPAGGGRSRIASRALAGSGGQAGSITLDVAGALELRPDALLTIANDASVANPAALRPTTLAVRAGSLSLEGAEITAAASGNARAGALAIETAGRLSATGSRISTTAVDGNGGPIRIVAGGPVLLKDSSITTSVSGLTNGNGGDITLTTPALALASGFVQANTTAPLAAGGNVVVEAALLVPDGSNVFVGGSRIAALRAGLAGYNVIQAAAPDGVAGQLDLTRPELNLSGNLVALWVPMVDFGLIGRDTCAAGTDSSFTVLGRGALPAAAAEPLRVAPRATR